MWRCVRVALTKASGNFETSTTSPRWTVSCVYEKCVSAAGSLRIACSTDSDRQLRRRQSDVIPEVPGLEGSSGRTTKKDL